MADFNTKTELYERVAKLETNVNNLTKSIDMLNTNHLPHMQEDIDKINAKLNKAMGGLAVLQIVLSIALAVYLN